MTISAEPGPVKGIRLGTASAGLYNKQRDDVLIIELTLQSSTALVLTRNAFQAAPVTIARRNSAHPARFLVINAGNANAGTGQQGLNNTEHICEYVAKQTGCESQQILPFSTGVIGQQLPLDLIRTAIPVAIDHLSPDGWLAAAQAIMTTDTRVKIASCNFQIAGQTCQITGIAKGSGMIHPDMATMLAFVATDASVPQAVLQNCLDEVVGDTFNVISVDGDTSTNDACVLMATGQAGNTEIEAGSAEYQQLKDAVFGVCASLAEQIVRDGEGATKFIRIQVESALSTEEAKVIGKTIAGSQLVKTAFFASDPNWGRILAAIGRSPVENLDVARVSIWLNEVNILQDGNPYPNYREEDGQRVMSCSEITIRVALQRGKAQATILSCDLSYDYVKINADYRT
ncbi:MAG: bifunctional glutamate N-acetyltransferase/amino-acid acetyltransferase ArgJ [Gammaproteobacteria bacterium]|nr:bifunctional glutamate N-acetyltransferase/amino-acid acetyltransferase ArgJ [Gammaproteobacteria bacterium]